MSIDRNKIHSIPVRFFSAPTDLLLALVKFNLDPPAAFVIYMLCDVTTGPDNLLDIK